MQLSVLVLFALIMSVPFASQEIGGLRALTFLPELMSVQILLYVMAAGARRRFDGVAPKYWLTFAALVLVIACGIASNEVTTGPIVSAARLYARAMPLFFLPAVCDFSDKQLQQQLRLLTWIALAQLPIAAYQRWELWSAGRYSGDPVQGSLTDSGALSIFLICAAAVATGFMLRGRLSKPRYCVLLLLLLLPTTINETKVSSIYVPLGLLSAFIVGAKPGKRLRVVMASAVLISLFGAIFLPVYNYFEQGDPYARLGSLTAIMTDQRKMDKYMSSDLQSVGSRGEIRRGDALRVPLQYLSEDPVRLALGLGLGSVSPSTLGRGFEGRYYPLFGPFLQTSFTYFVLEIGVLGVGIVLLLYWLIFRDAFFLARHDDGIVGAVAIGWVGTTMIMCVSLLYTDIHMFESLSYPFWYFSGLIASRRVALARQPSVSAAAVGNHNRMLHAAD